MGPLGRMLTASWVGLCLAVAPAAGYAAGPASDGAKIAVTPLQIEGKLSAEATAKIEERLLAGLERAGMAIVPPGDTVAGGATLPCGEKAGCIVKVARANEATHVLQVKIVKSGRDYSLEMILSSGNDGSTQAKSTQDCEICGLSELGELIGDQAASLQPKLEAVPGTLIVETSPSRATIKVDGKLIGVSPIVEPLDPGVYTITIAKPGYLERERKVTLVAGGEEEISIGLQPLPEVEVGASEPDGRGMRIAGWVLLGAGAGIVGGGVTLVLIDERPVERRCTPDNIDANGVCRFRHNTLGAGIGLAAAGGAALVAGAVLVGLGYKRKKQVAGDKRKAEKAEAFVVPTGLGLGVVGRF